jgi:hypothetical protein
MITADKPPHNPKGKIMSNKPAKPTRGEPDGDDYLIPGREGGRQSGTPAPRVHREPNSPMVKTK